MFQVIALVLLGSLLQGLGSPFPPPRNEPLPPPSVSASITPSDLRAHERFLASTELGGRHVASPSEMIAARYLASRLRSYGFTGGGDGGDFYQRFSIADVLSIRRAARISLSAAGSSLLFETEKDLWLQPECRTGEWNADLVYARFGVTQPEAGYDDYASIDARGKIAVITEGSPAVQKANYMGYVQDFPITLKVRTAAEHGAIALLLITRQASEDSRGTASGEGRSGPLALQSDLDRKRTIPVVQLSLRASQALLAGTPLTSEATIGSREPPPPQLMGRRATLEVTEAGKVYPAANVVGVLEGSDPKYKGEYVLFSAHYDHLRSVQGKIFRGADDDGSGTAAVLEIAEAFSLGPRPRRSILVVFHTGEEEGLLGSSYYVSHPTVPLMSIVSDLNIDMIGRSRAEGDSDLRDAELSDRNSVYLIGSDKLSSELHRLSEETNRETEHFNLDYRYNSADHPERLYYRSDHWNYAKNGIPVIFYFTGLHQDYHQTTDTIDKIDFEKMTRITRLILATGWRVANLDHRIVVDRREDGDGEGSNR